MTYVFDDIAAHLLDGGADHLISDFHYLNESNRLEAERVRSLVEDLMTRYPLPGRAELRARLRSRDDVTHQSAFFELAIHELILRAGCQASLHPTVPGTSKKPDFLVECPDGQTFYLEATLATGRSKEEEGAQKRLARALQTIDEVPSPDFFLSVRPRGVPNTPISGKRLKRELSQWLAGLDHAAIAAAMASGAPEPLLTFEEHGLHLRFTAMPRGSTRGSSGRAIGVHWLAGGIIHPEEPIADAIRGKAGRYGKLDLPYLIAVNALETYAREESAIDALFGSPAVAVTMMSDGSYHDRHIRQPDGVLRGKSGPECTRVSAVLSVDRLSPWTIGQAKARLIINPWAQRSLNPSVLPLPHILVEEERLRSNSGTSLSEVLGVWPGWPEDSTVQPTFPI
jgi:hypothetical protein